MSWMISVMLKSFKVPCKAIDGPLFPLPLCRRFQLRRHAKRLPEHQQVENDKTPAPEEKAPDPLRGGGTPERKESLPVDESQDENKEHKEKQQASEKRFSPEIRKAHKEERDETSDPMVLLLKFPHLDRLLFYDFGVELLLLQEDSVTVETDEFMIGCPQVESVGRASTHGTSRQEPFGPTVARHGDEKQKKKDGGEK